jgi:hypothetical protein
MDRTQIVGDVLVHRASMPARHATGSRTLIEDEQMLLRRLVMLGPVVGVALLPTGCDSGDTTGRSESASRVTMHDGRDDLWIEYADDRVPVNPNGDAVGAVVRRTQQDLVVTVRYADIERHANRTWASRSISTSRATTSGGRSTGASTATPTRTGGTGRPPT